ncbi:MAG: NUDIX domain-containing protein [Chloroflexi bacterium]|jgi:8-oxo-dGTP diphosphatase|nr:NUDIX domain-containing protein [Chloroflexota bacterium]
MRWEDQGTANTRRYTVVPRTLSFILHEGHVLLLRGAPDKPLWANLLNGVGGHLEPDEDPLSGAQREVREETGLAVEALALRAIVHIAGTPSAPGVLLFVFVGQTTTRQVRAGREGRLAWYPLDGLPWEEMVEDLRELLPRILAARPGDAPVYGHYAPDATGRMAFHFR